MASSQIIAFTDDDCLPQEFWLEEIIRCFHINNIQSISGLTIVPQPNCPTDHDLNTAGLESRTFITANCACTRNLLEKMNGFDERFTTAWRADSDLEFRLIEEGIHIERLSSAVVFHPVRKAGWGVSIGEQKKTLFNALLYRKHPLLYRERLQQKNFHLYYGILAYFNLLVVGIIISSKVLFAVGFFGWVTLTLFFAYQRLIGTRHSLSHILEMCVTSAIIPFLSIFWQWYGVIKYKVLFF